MGLKIDHQNIYVYKITLIFPCFFKLVISLLCFQLYLFMFLSNILITNYFFQQDELLRRAVEHYKGKNWKKIGNFVEATITLPALY